MKKTLCIALMFSVLVCTNALAENNIATETSGNFKLDANKVAEYQAKQSIKEDTQIAAEDENKLPQPKIITEQTENGKIEKLLNEKDQVIAEKTIEGDKIVKKVLNYYYPEGQLMRRITANDADKGFYAEEYYNNGKISAQSMFLDEQNKIGTEKKYDINGVLRQEIPWVEVKNRINEKRTIPQGIVKTYYPAGQLAATFAIGEKGDTIFYDYRGFVIKKISNSSILNFSKELTDADCQGISIQLSLDDLVELYEDEGDISYNKCGLPYRENFVYEVVKKHGARETKISYDETGMIRRITIYNNGIKDGVEKKYDASGNLTATINYKKGLKDGEAIGYFPTKEVAFRKTYAQGKVVDKLTCYFPTGEIAAEIFYKDGLKEGKATINSPIKQVLEFNKGERTKNKPEDETRQLPSTLTTLAKTEPECLKFDESLAKLMQSIDINEANIYDTFKIKLPSVCEDITSFKNENNKLVCYDLIGMRRASLPFGYNRGDFVIENVYNENNVLQYEIPYLDKKRQGWVKEYDVNGSIIAEIYYNKDLFEESARSYYPNGQVKEIIIISENMKNKLIAYYNEDGILQFSVTYKDSQRTNAYINNIQSGKDIAIRYYKGNIDNIRISEINNRYNFQDYNLALNEYTEYQSNQLIKGGKICSEEKSTTNSPSGNAAENMKLLQNIQVIVPSEKILSETNIDEVQTDMIVSEEEKMPEPPVISAQDAPIINDAILNAPTTGAKVNEEVISDLTNAIIPSAEEKKQAELAKKNIGPIAKPGINEFTDAVQKEKVNSDVKYAVGAEDSKTEKFYYPNGNLRKTIKTKGTRTEEIKEYSKNGLLLTDTVYGKDKITIEKYFGSGKVRRKTEKNYDDNAINSFVKRQDFYDSGKPRYEIERQPQTMLFSEKVYDTDGHLKSETIQNNAFSFKTKVYNKDENLIRETNELGNNVLVKEYDASRNVKNVILNGEPILTKTEINEDSLLANKAQVYGYNGKLLSAIRKEKNKVTIMENDSDGQIKTEIIFYDNGEISFRGYNSEKTLNKLAYLAQDGKLHIEKPFSKIIPAYRERYWVEYNNPRWIENQDRYSIKSIARLNLDIVSNICSELEIPVPDIINKLYKRYN